MPKSGVIKIGLNSLYQFIAKLINAFTALAIITIVLRSPDGTALVGAYTTILGYISLYFIFVDAGLNSIAVKQIIQSPHQQSKIISNLLNLRLLLALLTIVLCIIVLTFLNGPGYTSVVKNSVHLVSLTLLTQAILSTLSAYAQSNQNFKILLPINLLNSVVQLAVMLIISQNLVLSNLLIAYLAGAVVTLCASLIYLHKKSKLTFFRFQKQETLQLLRESAPITLSLFTNLVYFRIDALILPAYRGLEEIGRYNVAYRIFENILTLPTYATNSAYPSLLQQKQNSSRQYQKSFLKLLSAYMFISIFISITMHLLSPLLVTLIVGQPAPEVTMYLRILSYGTFFFFTSSALMTAIIIAGQQKWLAYIYLISMLLSISLNLYFIPIYGAIAAAYLTISLEALVCIMGVYVLYLHPTLQNLYRRRFPR